MSNYLAEGGFLAATDNAEVVVLGFDYNIDYAKIRTATRALLCGAELVVTNPDILTPSDHGFAPCVGAFLAALRSAVPSVEPVIVGKPSPIMIEAAFASLGSPQEHTIMLGDQVSTDMIGGRAAGLRTVLVTTGVPYVHVPGIEPDRTVANLLDLFATRPA